MPLALPVLFAPHREHGWGMKKTSENWPKFCILGGIRSSYCSDLDMQSLNENMGK